MKHVVSFSGGAGSWMAAKRVAARFGTENLILLFADVKMEDADLYRFVAEAAANVGGQFVTITEGRDPWEVFFKGRLLGNSQKDPCSRILKRDFLEKWCKKNLGPDDVIYLGIDWTESHRLEKTRKAKPHRRWEAPLCEAPFLSKADVLTEMRAEGIEPPRLYGMGFPHNNCGGFCIKAGQAQFALLLKTMPERYAYHEQREQEIRAHLDKNVSILRDRRGMKPGGKPKKLTLRVFRKRIELNDKDYDEEEWGGCGCALA